MACHGVSVDHAVAADGGEPAWLIAHLNSAHIPATNTRAIDLVEMRSINQSRRCMVCSPGGYSLPPARGGADLPASAWHRRSPGWHLLPHRSAHRSGPAF